jgi:predicted phage baseplate assembly protein
VLGHSDGKAGQEFHLNHTPVLARIPERDFLVVEPPGEDPQQWMEVRDFADSGPDDRHFVLDSLSGTLTLGPSLLQPDGTVYSFGAVPSKGSVLRFSHYQHGGGLTGNVNEGALRVLRSTIPYVASVENRQPGVGGRNAQSLEDAKMRAPQVLRDRTRAVTADDFEYLATQVKGVARARCLAPGAQPGGANDPKPGQVFVVVLPEVDEVDGRIPPERLTLSAELRAAVLEMLDARRLAGVSVDVRQPRCIWVSVHATVRVPERSPGIMAARVKEEAERVLYRYLNPFEGGPEGHGWPFGRSLHMSEVYARLQSVPNVEFVEDVQLRIREPGTSVGPPTSPAKLTIPSHAIICSGQHTVTVQ